MCSRGCGREAIGRRVTYHAENQSDTAHTPAAGHQGVESFDSLGYPVSLAGREIAEDRAPSRTQAVPVSLSNVPQPIHRWSVGLGAPKV